MSHSSLPTGETSSLSPGPGFTRSHKEALPSYFHFSARRAETEPGDCLEAVPRVLPRWEPVPTGAKWLETTPTGLSLVYTGLGPELSLHMLSSWLSETCPSQTPLSFLIPLPSLNLLPSLSLPL